MTLFLGFSQQMAGDDSTIREVTVAILPLAFALFYYSLNGFLKNIYLTILCCRCQKYTQRHVEMRTTVGPCCLMLNGSKGSGVNNQYG